jgi:hypothetical protein
VTSERTTVVLPDVHLGWSRRLRGGTGPWVHEAELGQFLDELTARLQRAQQSRQPESLHLILLGDLVDLERDEPLHGCLRAATLLAGKFRDLRQHQVRVTWVLGNHDHHLHNLMRGRLALLALLRRHAWRSRQLPRLRALVSGLEQLLFEGVDDACLQAFFEKHVCPLGDEAQAEDLRRDVCKALAEAREMRSAIEEAMGCELAYPAVSIDSGGRRLFATHGDVCDFMLLFGKLEGPSRTWLGRVCRWLVGVQGVRRTDVFGFHDWVYDTAERSIAQFERFFKQPPAVIARLVGEFLTSDYARRTLPKPLRSRIGLLAAVVGLALGPPALVGRWWRTHLGPRRRRRPRQVRSKRSAVSLSTWACGIFFGASAACLAAVATPVWLAVARGWPASVWLWLLDVALLLGLAPVLLFVLGLAGLVWRERVEEVLIDSLAKKRCALEYALSQGWFGAELQQQAPQLEHRIIGHFHFPEQSDPAQVPGLTDAGAWMGTGECYLLRPQHAPGDPGYELHPDVPLCSYVEVRAGVATLYNFRGPGQRWRFVGVREVEGKPVRCWEEVRVAVGAAAVMPAAVRASGSGTKTVGPATGEPGP